MYLYRNAATPVVLAFALVMVGCGGAGSSNPPQTITPSSTPLPPAAPTASLSANPSTVDKGGSTTLTWQTSNATDVSIDGVGAVQASGSQSVTPADSTTYTLTAKGAGGTQTAMATVTVTAPPPPPPPPPTGAFTITILQPLPGAAEATATGINDAGVVVGYSVLLNPDGTEGGFEATMWKDGVPSDLGSGIATAINSSNQVVGSFVDPTISVGADVGGADQAWFWSAATGRIVIGSLPDPGPDSVAAGIDADGTVVGQGFTNGTPAKEGLTWRMDLGINPVPGMNGIFGISSGFMAGQSDSGRAATVVVVEGQPTVTDLGAAADVQSMALAVNKLGHVCGQEDSTDGSIHAFFWNQSFMDLGTGNTRYSAASGINDLDQVVGILGTPGTGMLSRDQSRSWKHALARLQARPQTLDNFDRAMMWTQATGVVDLNTLVTSPDWVMSLANGINNKGEIVGTAFDQNQVNKAFILEPN